MSGLEIAVVIGVFMSCLGMILSGVGVFLVIMKYVPHSSQEKEDYVP